MIRVHSTWASGASAIAVPGWPRVRRLGHVHRQATDDVDRELFDVVASCRFARLHLGRARLGHGIAVDARRPAQRPTLSRTRQRKIAPNAVKDGSGGGSSHHLRSAAVLSPLDDYPIHQAARSMRHVGHRATATSTTATTSTVTARPTSCSSSPGMGQYPNLGVQDAFVVRPPTTSSTGRARSRELGTTAWTRPSGRSGSRCSNRCAAIA